MPPDDSPCGDVAKPVVGAQACRGSKRRCIRLQAFVRTKKWEGQKALPPAGVADGTRTRDSQDHNLVLYQLNYSHHRYEPVRASSPSILTAGLPRSRILWLVV